MTKKHISPLIKHLNYIEMKYRTRASIWYTKLYITSKTRRLMTGTKMDYPVVFIIQAKKRCVLLPKHINNF